MATSLEELALLMSSPSEGQQLEFKAAKNQFDQQKLCRYCIAIANEGGGRLVLGVSDEVPRRVVGTAAYNDLVDLHSKLLNWVGFRVDVEALLHPDGRVLVFHIPGRHRGTAYQLDGAYYMRSGDELVAMTPDRLKVIFAEGQQDFADRIALEEQVGADVVRLLDTQSYFDRVGLPTRRNDVPSSRDFQMKDSSSISATTTRSRTLAPCFLQRTSRNSTFCDGGRRAWSNTKAAASWNPSPTRSVSRASLSASKV